MKGRFGFLGALVLGLFVCSMATKAASQEDVANQIAERFDVRVLDVKPGEIDGREVWLVKVMKRGGNSNDAFRVNVLAVDQESGSLVPTFRHGRSGYDLPERPAGGDIEGVRPDAARSGVWR